MPAFGPMTSGRSAAGAAGQPRPANTSANSANARRSALAADFSVPDMAFSPLFWMDSRPILAIFRPASAEATNAYFRRYNHLPKKVSAPVWPARAYSKTTFPIPQEGTENGKPQCQRQNPGSRRRSFNPAAVGVARAGRTHRHQIRLRYRAVRLVHRARRRRGGAFLRDAGRGGAGAEKQHERKPPPPPRGPPKEEEP